MVLVPDHEPPEVLQPGKEALNLPTTLGSPEFTAVLGLVAFPTPSMRGDHVNTPLAQRFIKAVAVVGLVADQPFRRRFDKTLIERFFYQRYFVG